LVYDTIVTGLDDGAFAYFGGADTVYYVLASDVLPVTNDHVLAYNSGTDRLYWKADADTGGAPALSAVTAPTAAWSIAFDDEEKVTWTTSQATVGSFFTITNPVDPVAAQLYLLDLTYSVDDGQALADYIIAKDGGGTVFTLEQDGDVVSAGNIAGATYGSDESISDAELLTLDDGAVTEILVGGGAGSAPVWGTDIPTAVTLGTKYIYRADGTDVPDADVADDITLASTKKISTTLTTEQLRLNYDGTNYATWTVDATGATTVATVDADGALAHLTFSPNGTIILTPATDVVGALTAASVTSDANVAGLTYGSDASISDAELLTLDDGATTEILVGGGAGSAPVWTTATGTGAPVRAGSPTLTGTLTVPNLDVLGAPFPTDPGADRVLTWDDSETGAELIWGVAGVGDVLADGSVPFTSTVTITAAAPELILLDSDAAAGTGILSFQATGANDIVASLKTDVAGTIDLLQNTTLTGTLTGGSATVDSGAVTLIQGAQAGDPQVILDLTLQVQDEDIVFSDGGADLINVASSTSVATVDFQTINLATDALDLSEGDISNVGTVKADILEPDAVANGNLVVRSGQTAADTLKIQVYDVDGTAYVDAITLTANNSVTMAIDTSDWDIDATGAISNTAIDGDTNAVTNIANAAIKWSDIDNLADEGALVIADESTDTTSFPLFVTAATGNLAAKTGSNLTFNSATGNLGVTILTATGAIAANGDSITSDGVLVIDATSATSFNDENITNVGDIAVDTITADAAGITIDSVTTGTITIGSADANVVIVSDAMDVSEAGAVSGVTTLAMGGALSGVTTETLTHTAPAILFVDSTTSGEANIAVSDAAGPDGIMDLQVDIGGTLTSLLQLDGATGAGGTVDILVPSTATDLTVSGTLTANTIAQSAVATPSWTASDSSTTAVGTFDIYVDAATATLLVVRMTFL
jgi:hypothetical protein